MPLKLDYSVVTSEHGDTPYVLPPIPCGWYKHTGQYGEETIYQFRRMPRAGKYAGKYGLWLKDTDAGMVLIGVVQAGNLEPVERVYTKQFDAFPKAVLYDRKCSWCGRELLDDTRLCHESPKCEPKGAK